MLGSTLAFQGSMTWLSPRGTVKGCTLAVPDTTTIAIALPAAAWDNGVHYGR